MKVWLKLLIGSLLGVMLGFLLPHGNEAFTGALFWLESFAIRIGRYTAAPIMLFSLTIAVYELRQDGQFWRLVFRAVPFLLITAAVVILAGILATLSFPPGRIPIATAEQVETLALGTGDNVRDLFPSNMLSVPGGDGIYLLPVYVFAFFLGIGLSYDRSYVKPVIALVDSLSRIFYHIASLFSEILGIVMIALGAYWAVSFQGLLKTEGFRDLVVLLGVLAFVLGFVVFPLLLYLLKPAVNPWRILYGTLGAGIAGFFSGDINFTLPVLLRHVRENLGVRRRANAVTLSIFSSFGRAGSAMVAAVAFIVIIKSYSSLEITRLDILTIAVRAFLVSFLLVRRPGDGAFTALAVLCLGYGQNFDAGYLILKPMAFYLAAVGTFLDVVIASFASFVIARQTGFQEDKTTEHFI
ncbi:transporter [Spirochaetia bacterium]|nr:transporter [Spirochaetia bacterium]